MTMSSSLFRPPAATSTTLNPTRRLTTPTDFKIANISPDLRRSRNHYQPLRVNAAAVVSPDKTQSTAPVVLRRVSSDSLRYETGFVGAVPDRSKLKGVAAGDVAAISAMEYLTNILSSKVYDVAVESPLQLAEKLSERLGTSILLKREDLQPVFSFKLRGAYNMMAKLPREQLDKGVICSSAGNHAQGVALSARKLNCDAVIVMPITTPEIKWKSVKRLGANVVLIGDSYDEAQSYAKKRALEEGRTFVPPFDHPDIIMGQGTVGTEIISQMKGRPLHAIFVPVGGGGLIAGIAAYVKRVKPEVKIIGVEPFDANAMALSLHHGERITLDKVGGFADGVAVKVVGEETFRICEELVDGVVLVNRDAICASIKNMFEEKRSILEPAGALALAGAEAYCKYYGIKDENIVVITSGANMNFDRLRLVTELADVGRQREAVLATFMAEKPGSFKKFSEKFAANFAVYGHLVLVACNIQFATIAMLCVYSVGLHTASELEEMIDRMESVNLRTINLTNNDLVKDHLRHLGETGANVLVGIQVPPSEIDEFRMRADNLGYVYTIEDDSEVYEILMH
ncbi:hypothetical protein KSS87_022231 [Heliosperma pusillum]|nr:hypothetical protein KSS87_022231 [Heliosperma pusillum]